MPPAWRPRFFVAAELNLNCPQPNVGRFCCKSRRWEDLGNWLYVLIAFTAPARFSGGAFEAVALTTATLTQHKQRRLVVAQRTLWPVGVGSVR